MARKRKDPEAEEPSVRKRKDTGAKKTRAKETKLPQVREPEIELVEEPVVRRARVRRVREPEVIEVIQEPDGKKWFGVKPWIVILGGIGLLLLFTLPVFSATKTIQVTETIMVPEAREEPETVEVEKDVKVYVGWMREEGVLVTRTGYRIAYDYWGDPYYVPYTYQTRGPGQEFSIAAVDEIVELQQVREPGGTWCITLIDHSGQETIYRDIDEYDLTKTGRATVTTTETKMRTWTEEVPQEVTKDEVIKVRVNLISLIAGNY